MLRELIEKARESFESYEDLAKELNTDKYIMSHWKNGRRKPSAFEICYLADIAGLNPLETLAKVQAEIDTDNSSSWNKWCAQRDSNARPLPSEGNINS